MRALEQISHGYQGMTVISYLTHDRRQGRGGEGREGRKSDDEMEGRGEAGGKAMMDQEYIEK